MPFAVSLWRKGGFSAQTGSIIGGGVSSITIPPIVNFFRVWPTFIVLYLHLRAGVTHSTSLLALQSVSYCFHSLVRSDSLWISNCCSLQLDKLLLICSNKPIRLFIKQPQSQHNREYLMSGPGLFSLLGHCWQHCGLNKLNLMDLYRNIRPIGRN